VTPDRAAFDEVEVRAALRRAESPRVPSAELDARLRSELFGTEPAAPRPEADAPADDSHADLVVLDLDPLDAIGSAEPPDATRGAGPARRRGSGGPASAGGGSGPVGPTRARPGPARRSSRRKTALVAIAAAAAVSVMVAAVILARTPEPEATVDVGPDPSTTATVPATVDDAAAARACARMRESAFAPLTRSDVLGPRNEDVLMTRDEVRVAASTLLDALETWRSDMRVAGVDDDVFFERLDLAVARVGRVAGRLESDEDLTSMTLLDWLDLLESSERYLLDAEHRLIDLAIPGCP